MAVVPFKLSKESALKIIRDTDTRHILPNRFAEDKWPHVVLRRQVIRCLDDGEMTGKPVPTELGHWEYQMERIDSGQEIYITVVLYQNEKQEWNVFVKEVSNGHY